MIENEWCWVLVGMGWFENFFYLGIHRYTFPLDHYLAASCKFWYLAFLFSFTSKYFPISFVISLICQLFKSMLFNFDIFVNFQIFLPLLISNFIPLWFIIQFTLGIVPSVGLYKCTTHCIHLYGIIECFTSLKNLCSTYSSFFLSPQPLAATDCLVSIVLPVLECHIFRIVQDVTFSHQLFSFSAVHFKLFLSFHSLLAQFF